ncbi:hypothetical protein DVH24_019864 [Malus domestica]|uniref:Uncharacterized protein n=1 Tax=Malus domestica TaxID=3750 RepID=A0A498I039_MALDO|nr:hypothetical protein DVH24_019864 [Malus domestica]
MRATNLCHVISDLAFRCYYIFILCLGPFIGDHNNLANTSKSHIGLLISTGGIHISNSCFADDCLFSSAVCRKQVNSEAWKGIMEVGSTLLNGMGWIVGDDYIELGHWNIMKLRTIVPEGSWGCCRGNHMGRRKFQGGSGIASVKRVELLAVRQACNLRRLLGAFRATPPAYWCNYCNSSGHRVMACSHRPAALFAGFHAASSYGADPTWFLDTGATHQMTNPGSSRPPSLY